MAMDLSEVKIWNQTAMEEHIHPGPTPYHFKAFNDKYWKEIATRPFYINEPVELKNGEGIINLTLNIEALIDYIEDPKQNLNS